MIACKIYMITCVFHVFLKHVEFLCAYVSVQTCFMKCLYNPDM